jgi:DnaJ-domain-containing protein 1
MMRIAGKPLSELTDQELETELQRRRRARGSSATDTSSLPRSAPSRLAAAVRRSNVRQWYTNLELNPGATRAEIEAAYQRLMERYSPDKHRGNPERFRDATRLTEGLTEAYRGLLGHLRDLDR